jgi:hypothetical protein
VEHAPQNPGDKLQSSADTTDASQPLARTSPGGLVYTSALQPDSTGKYVVVVCVANVGDQDVPAVDVLFALLQHGSAITSLRAPASPSEVSNTQARAILGSIPPHYQMQLEIAVRADQPLTTHAVQVVVPKAYRLTETDPALRCAAHGGSSAPPELVRAQFTLGGQTISVRDVAQELFGAAATSTNPAYLASLGSAPIAAHGLAAALAVTALLIIGLAAAAFISWRR